MGVPDERTRSRCKCPVMRPTSFLYFLAIVLFLTLVTATAGFALQKPALLPSDSQSATPDQHVAAQEKAPADEPAAPVKPPVAAAHPPAPPPQPPAAPVLPPTPPVHPPAQTQPHGGEQPKTAPHAPATLPKGPEGAHGEAAPGAAEHGQAHAGDHVVLPEISPTPGVTFVDTIINLMDHELHGRTLGWRPNDIIIGRFTDDINNYQLGVLEAIRFTTLRLKDSLSRLSEADSYDPDLEQAVNLLMNSATAWWFPSAESSYSLAIEHLKNFRTKLEKGQRSVYYRRDTLVALLSAYKDQIGNVNRTLVMPVGWFQADDYFYYAKGVAHVYSEILKVCRVGFKNQLATMHATDIMDEVLHELLIAELIDPWIILNSGFGGFLANHRANLNAPLSEVAHLLVVLSQL